MGSSDYILRLKTDVNLGSDSFIGHFLDELVSTFPPVLRAELCDFGEPVKRHLDPSRIALVANEWRANGIGPIFARRTQPRYLMEIDWRANRGDDPRVYPWGCTVQLDSSAGDETAFTLLKSLIQNFSPVFGCLTTEADYREKHFGSVRTREGRKLSYEGQEIGDTFPGIYWVTFLGKSALSELSAADTGFREQFAAESFHGGLLIRAFPTSSECGTREGSRKEQEIRRRLGKKRFFEKRRRLWSMP